MLPKKLFYSAKLRNRGGELGLGEEDFHKSFFKAISFYNGNNHLLISFLNSDFLKMLLN